MKVYLRAGKNEKIFKLVCSRKNGEKLVKSKKRGWIYEI